MATKRKTIDETKRPWRAVGGELREMIGCPLCAARSVRVVAYRKNTVRFECATCDLRFSLSPLDVANALRLRARAVLEGMQAGARAQGMGLTLAMLAEARAIVVFREAFVHGTEDTREDMLVRVLQDSGTTIATGVLAKPSDTPEERAQRLEQIR